jgi:hypothetical protein
MVAEIYGGLTAAKAAFDIAKGLKDIHDATLRNAAVIELQEKILSAHETQAALVDRVRDLEKEVAAFEAWETEKKKYKLYHLGWAAYAYMLKLDTRGCEPPHWICAKCFSDKRIFIIQMIMFDGQKFLCPSCKNDVTPPGTAFDGHGSPRWLD